MKSCLVLIKYCHKTALLIIADNLLCNPQRMQKDLKKQKNKKLQKYMHCSLDNINELLAWYLYN